MIAVFGGHTYYPAGGWGDLIEVVETLADAKGCRDEWYQHERGTWWHFVDLDRGIIVDQGMLKGDY